MKTIVAGSRDITDLAQVIKAIKNSGIIITELVSGGARGVDRLGEYYAISENIPIKYFRPDWSKGKHAGFTRNVEMAEYADALIAVWDGYSKGTANMITVAKRLGLIVYVE